jgi:hypothetical protein
VSTPFHTKHRRTAAALLTLATAATSLALVPYDAATAAPAAPARPDLVVTGPRVDRTTIAEGAVLTVTHRVKNAGRAKAGASRTRFYLTRDAAASLAARRASRTNPRSAPTDLLLTGVKAVPGLARGKQSAVLTTKVTVPVGVQPGAYRVLVCADDQAAVREKTETNNCAVAGQALKVTAAPGARGLSLEQFVDTAQWPEDESEALEWMKLFCKATYPVKTFTTASALASVESYLRTTAGADAMNLLATSGLADDAAESEQLATTALSQGSPGLALAALLRARRFEPRSGSHLLNIAALATSVGLPNEGLALLDGLPALEFGRAPLGIQPQAIASAVRGQALALTGRLGPARTAFTAARVAEPLLSEADAGLAVVEACSGNDAKALRFARRARQRSETPKPPTEDPTKPEPTQPDAPLDLSRGVLTPLRQLPIAETPAQGVAMEDEYDAIADGFFAEIDADNAEEDAIRERLRAVDQVSTPAEQMRRDDITLLAYLVGTNGDEADRLQETLFDKIDVITEHREEFFGGGTGEVAYTYDTLATAARDACQGAKDYSACVTMRMNETCRPALTAAHTQWRGLMSEAQTLADAYLVELSSRMSAYAANLADPDAHRRIILQIEGIERSTYALLVQQAQFWTTSERLHEDYCVTPVEVPPTPAAPGEPDGASPGACQDPLQRISIAATLGPTKIKINCEQVKQELAIDVIPALQAFGEVSLNFRTGKVTFFAGSKFKQGLGPAEAQFKSGIYLTTDGRGGIDDVGWRVGGEIKGSNGPYEVSIAKDYEDISFLGAFSTTP